MNKNNPIDFDSFLSSTFCVLSTTHHLTSEHLIPTHEYPRLCIVDHSPLPFTNIHDSRGSDQTQISTKFEQRDDLTGRRIPTSLISPPTMITLIEYHPTILSPHTTRIILPPTCYHPYLTTPSTTHLQW